MAGLLCLLILLCGVLAANAGWHQWLHGDDEGNGSAACAVCVFAAGGCDQPQSEPPPPSVPIGWRLELTAPTVGFLPTGFRDGFRGRSPPTRVG